MEVARCGVFFIEVVLQVADAEAVAGGLVGVGRTDAFSGGAYFCSPLGALVGSVEQAVCGEDEMGLARTRTSPTPLPMMLVCPCWKIPEGIERSTYFLPSNSRVWPALGPPWKRATAS